MLYFFVLVFAFGIILFFIIQTSSFQTYLGRKATDWLSNELKTELKIERIDIDFFNSVSLNGILIKDLRSDTLIYLKDLTCKLNELDLKNNKIHFNQLAVNNGTVKSIIYKNDSLPNYQFLVDYFSSPTDTTTSKPFDLDYGDIKMSNLNLVYKNENDTLKPKGINYSDLSVQNFSGNINHLNFEADTISVQLTHFSLKEKCGLIVHNLNVNAKISPTGVLLDSLILKTQNSFIKGNYKMLTKNWDDYSDFVNKVKLDADLKDSTSISAKDIGYFVDQLYNNPDKIKLSGKINGKIPSLYGKSIVLKFGNNTNYKGDFYLQDIVDIDNTFFHFNINELSTDAVDLEKIHLPPYEKNTTLVISDQLKTFGKIAFKGLLIGKLNDVIAKGKLVSNIGSVETDVSIKNLIDQAQLPEYEGKLKTQNFNLGLILGNNDIGIVSMDVNLEGKGFELEELEAKMEGNVQQLFYNNYNYNNIKITGSFSNKKFNGKFECKDENADLDFYGSANLASKIPELDFISTINKLNLTKLHFLSSDSSSDFSSQVVISLQGKDLNHLSGRINFDNSILNYKSSKFKMSVFDLTLNQSEENKSIKLSSSVADVNLNGFFNLTNLGEAFRQVFAEHYPTYIQLNKSAKKYYDQFDFNVKIKKLSLINGLFFPDLNISQNTKITGSFDASKNYIQLNSTSDLITYANNKIRDFTLDIKTTKLNGLDVLITSDKINLTDSLSLQNFLIRASSLDTKSNFGINWDNQQVKKNYSGTVDGLLDFTKTGLELKFDKIYLTIADSIWQMFNSNLIVADTSGTITIDTLKLANAKQSIALFGRVSKSHNDKLFLNLNKFKLKQLNPFLISSGTTLNGFVSGNFSIADVYSKIIFASSLDFDKLELNNKPIGSGEVNCVYDYNNESISMIGSFKKQYASGTLMDPNFKNLFFKGDYFPTKKENNINLEVEIKSIDIAVVQPYVKDILTFGKGYVSGKTTITGNLNKPIINGNLSLESVRNLKVDYLNTYYTAIGNILIEPERIAFEGITLFDNNGKMATVWGNIFHDNFSNIKLDFDITANKFMVLNTNPIINPDYYGKAFVTGNVGIWSQNDDINIEVNVKTEKGTIFNIPLAGTEEVGENEFITFIKKDTSKSTIQEKTDLSNLKLVFNLEATRDADIQLIFDEKAGDVIKANGNGVIKMDINTNGNFEMFGTYTINDGNYLFTLENFINKKFDIESGSTIKWTGNPYNAEINITANYRQRASLNPFFPSVSATSTTAGNGDNGNSTKASTSTSDDVNKRYPVECKLYMRDKLLTPEITFGINLPSVNEEKRQQVMGYINNEQELNRQVFSLLLLKSFVTPLALNTQSGVNAGNAVGANATEMLSNQLSNWLSQLSSNIDVGVNYTPGSSLSNEELDLALSTQLFNDKLNIDGNVGLNNNTQTKTSNVIGDVNIDYKLNDEGKVRIKAFNRSNDTYQTTTSGGQFTQGLGVFFREEFDSIDELYNRYKKKISRKK
jgi:hypothetical protein